jgi:methylenetetrahydrofolate--tRNA-(uracil-5-)-methyltransferase
MGLVAGRLAAADALGISEELPPETTALGSLIAHITGGHLSREGHGIKSFQPMNINFGLFPPVTITRPEDVTRWRGPEKTKAKKRAITSRALFDLEVWRYGASAEKSVPAI